MNYKVVVDSNKIGSKSNNILETFNQIINPYENEYNKIQSDLKLILDGQKVAKRDIQLGFIGLAKRNDELIEFNEKLNRKLEAALAELNILKKEREKKAILKETRANRKRLAKRQPMTLEIYNLLIRYTTSPNYRSVRLRIALCLLFVTGIRINELLSLKVYQLQTLLDYHWISIDRSKRGPSSHKAFLTQEGVKVVKEREKDFKFLFHMKNSDSYVFTSELHHDRMLRRETITRDVNQVMRSVSRSLADQPLMTSHSFRIGYISKLWRYTKDIEFVRQSIGHRRLDTTSSYVTRLSDQERQERSSEL